MGGLQPTYRTLTREFRSGSGFFLLSFEIGEGPAGGGEGGGGGALQLWRNDGVPLLTLVPLDPRAEGASPGQTSEPAQTPPGRLPETGPVV